MSAGCACVVKGTPQADDFSGALGMYLYNETPENIVLGHAIELEASVLEEVNGRRAQAHLPYAALLRIEFNLPTCNRPLEKACRPTSSATHRRAVLF